MRRLTLLCVFGCLLAGTTNSKDQSKPGTKMEDWSGLSNTFGFQTPPPDGNVNKDEKDSQDDPGEFTPMEGHNMTINSSKVPDQKDRTNDTVTWNGTWIPIGNTGGFSSPLPDKKDKKKPPTEVAASPTTPKPEEPGTIIEDWGGFSNTFGFQTPPPDGNVNKKEED